MKKNGFHRSLNFRSSVAQISLWFIVASLTACGESAVVSQMSGADVPIAGGTLLDQASENLPADDAIVGGVSSEETDSAATDSTDDGASDGLSTLKIMAVGDSITHGFGGARSYRKPLIDLLQASGCEFEMVGSMTENLPATGFESPHEAYSGHRTDSFLTGQQSSFGNNQGISESMMQFVPRLVLLNIGTNDMNQNRNVDNVIANIDQIVALIFDVEPQAQVVISTLVPFFKSADPADAVNIRLEQLSNALEAWFVQAANPRVYLIDTRDGFTADMMLPDLIHPGDTGDAFIADKFHQSIEDNNLCG